MSAEKCGCGGHKEEQGCQGCQADAIFIYWCDSCQRSVAEKRCPYCGLKAQKKKGG
jgi:predicted RNA-binding protein with PUA domain